MQLQTGINHSVYMITSSQVGIYKQNTCLPLQLDILISLHSPDPNPDSNKVAQANAVKKKMITHASYTNKHKSYKFSMGSVAYRPYWKTRWWLNSLFSIFIHGDLSPENI